MIIASIRQQFRDLDRILRGEATRLSALRTGRIEFGGRLGFLLAALGASYGFFMGWFALTHDHPAALMQLVACTVKVPALFVATFFVTLPSLYVFNSLIGSRLSFTSVLRLIVASAGVIVAVLASLGTIVGFFSLTTESYSFMVILNVAVFSVAGVLGLGFLLRTLERLTAAIATPAPETATAPRGALSETSSTDRSDEDRPVRSRRKSIGALDEDAAIAVFGRDVRSVFRAWVALFAVVGGQMAWVLRPFIGNPELPFTWFRARESNFFEAVWNHFWAMFG